MIDYMYEDMSPERSLAHWAIFGTDVVGFLEHGILYTDLHNDNLLFADDIDRIVALDWEDNEDIDYPRDRELAQTALMSLLSWLPIDLAAAFRFGFLTQGGPVAKAIFDGIRRRYGFHAFTDETMLAYEPESSISAEGISADRDLQDADHTWRADRAAFAGVEHSDPGLDEFHKWKAKRKTSTCDLSSITEFYVRRHIIAAAHYESGIVMLEALLAAQEFYRAGGRFFEAMGIGKLIVSNLNDSVVHEGMGENQQTLAPLLEKNQESLASHISAASIARLARMPVYKNVFHHLWAIDDLMQGNVRSVQPTVT